MRNTILVALLALSAATGVFAQRGPRDGDRTPLTPAELVDRRVQTLTTLLTLDASQQAQAKTIFTDEVTASQALRDKAEAAQDAFRTAVSGGTATDAQIDSLAAAIGTIQGQSLAVHAKAQTKFRAILTSAQKEKLDASRQGGFGFGGGPGFGGPGRPPMRNRAPQQ